MCTNVRKQLKITLRSDFICGSGVGWGNVVDTDVVYDALGFPYIPARRIRGLLKEALWELEQFGVNIESSKNLFGDEEREGHFFKLYNAQLKNIKELREEVKMLNLNSIDVLSYYTTLRYQTSIDKNGIALDKTLRSVRALRKGIVFYADMQCKEEDLDILKKCCALIKHMGTNRTRGFGEVTLEIIDIDEESKVDFKKLKDDLEKIEDKKYYKVKLCLRNLTQLSVTSTKGEKSVDYISGSSILGFFANNYLKTHPVDGRFYELFVKGALKFHNAYITDYGFNESMPVRESLFKEKTGDKYFDKMLYKPISNSTPIILKKVRDKYIVKNSILEPMKEMVYHHRRPHDKSVGHAISNEKIEDGGFYQLEVLSENQNFVSYIQGKGKDVKEVLKNCPRFIQIGKSKTTQYGNVELVNIDIKEVNPNKIPKGTEVICTLLSPMVILNEKIEPDLTSAMLLKTCSIEQNKDTIYHVGYTQVGGFNAKWKLQKPSYHAFSKGTCIRGILSQDVFEYESLGALQQEGNGVVYYQPVPNNSDGCFEINKENTELTFCELEYEKDIYLNYVKSQICLRLYETVQQMPKPEINNTTINKTIKTLEQIKLSDVETWLKEKTAKTEDKKETKLRQQNDKYSKIQEIINKIKKVCDKQINEAGLKKLLSDEEKKAYTEDLYVMMIKQYFVHHKRGDE